MGSDPALPTGRGAQLPASAWRSGPQLREDPALPTASTPEPHPAPAAAQGSAPRPLGPAGCPPDSVPCRASGTPSFFHLPPAPQPGPGREAGASVPPAPPRPRPPPLSAGLHTRGPCVHRGLTPLRLRVPSPRPRLSASNDLRPNTSSTLRCARRPLPLPPRPRSPNSSAPSGTSSPDPPAQHQPRPRPTKQLLRRGPPPWPPPHRLPPPSSGSPVLTGSLCLSPSVLVLGKPGYT